MAVQTGSSLTFWVNPPPDFQNPGNYFQGHHGFYGLSYHFVKVDAKTTPSYFLGPTYIGNIITFDDNIGHKF